MSIHDDGSVSDLSDAAEPDDDHETAPLTETVNVVYGSTIDEVTKAM
ncbi:MAG: hypothetical protein ACLVJ6_10300 [Merdibacter sp.]